MAVRRVSKEESRKITTIAGGVSVKKPKMPLSMVGALRSSLKRYYVEGRSPNIVFALLPPLKPNLEALPKNKPVRVLDVGCGDGTTIETLKSTYPRWEFHGINLRPPRARFSKIFIGIDNKVHEVGSLPREANYAQGEASRLPYDSNTFDVVYSAYMLPYVPDKLKAVQEMLRVTKPRGVVMVHAPVDLREKRKLWFSKNLDILSELKNIGIAAERLPSHSKFKDMLYIRKSNGDDEKSMPFEFVGPGKPDIWGWGTVKSYYRRLKK